MTPLSRPTSAPALPTEELGRRFEQLASEWEQAIASLSDSTLREGHPAYRAVVGLGTAVVPLLLADLERTHRHWFSALRESRRAARRKLPVERLVGGLVGW